MSIQELIMQMSEEYFNKEPNSPFFKLPKAVIGKELGLNKDKQGQECKAVVFALPFIKDTMGYLVIDKEGMKAWLDSSSELENKELTVEERKRITEKLEKDIETTNQIVMKYDELIPLCEQSLKEKQVKQASLFVKLNSLDYQNYLLDEEIFLLNAQINERKPEIERQEKERQKLFTENQNLRNRLITVYQESNWFMRWWKSNPFEYTKALLNEADRVLSECWK